LPDEKKWLKYNLSKKEELSNWLRVEGQNPNPNKPELEIRGEKLEMTIKAVPASNF
jgi:hypothetical protein